MLGVFRQVAIEIGDHGIGQLATRFDGEKFHSKNLYELLGYLTNYEPEAGESLAGMLAYPQVDRPVSQRIASKALTYR